MAAVGPTEGAPVPTPPGHDVRLADLEEADALARTLAHAFHEDPVFNWMFPDPEQRMSTSERAFALYLKRIWMRHEETYRAAGTAGACVWEPPGTWKIGIGTQLSVLPAMARIYGRALPRVLSALNALEKGHPAEPHHYYLAFMGVEPESQGRGMGSGMMFPVLERCDSAKVAAYLEASSPRNRSLYERHGFSVTEEFHVGRGSPPVWRMWRDPQ